MPQQRLYCGRRILGHARGMVGRRLSHRLKECRELALRRAQPEPRVRDESPPDRAQPSQRIGREGHESRSCRLSPAACQGRASRLRSFEVFASLTNVSSVTTFTRAAWIKCSLIAPDVTAPRVARGALGRIARPARPGRPDRCRGLLTTLAGLATAFMSGKRGGPAFVPRVLRLRGPHRAEQ